MNAETQGSAEERRVECPALKRDRPFAAGRNVDLASEDNRIGKPLDSYSFLCVPLRLCVKSFRFPSDFGFPAP